MKNPFVFLSRYPYVISLFIVALLFGWFYEGKVPSSSSPSSAEDTGLYHVRTQNMEIQEIVNEVEFYGTTQPFMQSDIASKGQGRILIVHVEEGDLIKKGDVIAEIELDSLIEKEKTAINRVNETKKKYAAYLELDKKGFASKIQLIEAETEYKDALAQLKSLKNEVNDKLILAPIDGVISKLDAEVGDLVSQQSIVGQISDLSRLETEINIPERYVGQVKVGNKAKVIFRNGKSVDAEVSFISKVADDEVHTFRSKILSGEIIDAYAGMSSSVTLYLDNIKGYRVSPFILGISKNKILTLKTVDNNVVKSHEIRILKTFKNNDVFVYSTELPEAAEVISLGSAYVSDGEKVKHTLMNSEEA